MNLSAAVMLFEENGVRPAKVEGETPMIEPGDYVECIKSEPPYSADQAEPGKVYLVLDVVPPELCILCGECPGLVLSHMNNYCNCGCGVVGFCACCFRPLHSGERAKLVCEEVSENTSRQTEPA